MKPENHNDLKGTIRNEYRELLWVAILSAFLIYTVL
jgi:hypothetical protein